MLYCAISPSKKYSDRSPGSRQFKHPWVSEHTVRELTGCPVHRHRSVYVAEYNPHPPPSPPLRALTPNACCHILTSNQSLPASKEYSAFLQGLVFSVVPSGLRDQEEDVCAAAARAARLVTKRFLPLSWRMPTNGEARRGTSPASSAGSGNRGSSGGSDTAGSRDSGGNARRENKQEEEEEVFDLVWKALGALHKHSACVEVRRKEGVEISR